MKQYVLDEPGARRSNPAPEEAAGSPGRWWRWPVVGAALGAVSLVVVHSFGEARPEPARRSSETALVPAYVAPIAVEPQHAPVAATHEEPPAAARPTATAPPAEPRPSRVTRESGRYVVDLHGTAMASALAMLSEATRTSVTGSDVLAASPSRITTSFVADSPLDAWKGVFGDIASFAMTCGRSSCAVRFVSLVGERPTSLSPPVPARPLAPAPADSMQSSEPAPDN